MADKCALISLSSQSHEKASFDTNDGTSYPAGGAQTVKLHHARPGHPLKSNSAQS